MIKSYHSKSMKGDTKDAQNQSISGNISYQ